MKTKTPCNTVPSPSQTSDRPEPAAGTPRVRSLLLQAALFTLLLGILLALETRGGDVALAILGLALTLLLLVVLHQRPRPGPHG